MILSISGGAFAPSPAGLLAWKQGLGGSDAHEKKERTIVVSTPLSSCASHGSLTGKAQNGKPKPKPKQKKRVWDPWHVGDYWVLR